MLRTILVQTERAINCADHRAQRALQESDPDLPGRQRPQGRWTIRPDGPTIHALGFKAIGQEDGKPSGYDAADFKQRTGRNGNRTLSGKPIFDIPGEGGGAGAPAAATTLPAGGEANAPFGGPLELTGAKSESGVASEIAGKAATQPVRPQVTQRQAEQESMAALKKVELRQVEFERRAKTFVPPPVGTKAFEFSKAAAEKAIRMGRIPDTTAKRLAQAMRGGSDWLRSQAIAYMLRIELANKSIIDQLEKDDPALVKDASKRWARFRHYGLAAGSVRKTGLARALHIIDGLDRYKNLTAESRNRLSEWLNNLRDEFDVPDSAYNRFRSIKRGFRMNPGRIRVPLTDLALLRAIDRKTGGGLKKALIGIGVAGLGVTALGRFTGPAGLILSIQGLVEVLDIETLKALEKRRRGEEFTQRSFSAATTAFVGEKEAKAKKRSEGSGAIRFE